MLSGEMKREIAEFIQELLQDVDDPEMARGEISFLLHIDGNEISSWANIRNVRERHIPAPENLCKNMSLSREDE